MQAAFIKFMEPLIDRVFVAKDSEFGLWLAGITRLAMNHSLVPTGDPRLDESLRFENA